MKLTFRFLGLLAGFTAVFAGFALFNGRDPFIPGGPIAGALAAMIMGLPVVAIIDWVRLWRERGRASGQAR